LHASGVNGEAYAVQTASSRNFANPSTAPGVWAADVGSTIALASTGTVVPCKRFSYFFDVITVPSTHIALLGQSNALGSTDSPPTYAVPELGELWIRGARKLNYGHQDRVGVEQLLEPSRKLSKVAWGGTDIAEWLDFRLDIAFADTADAGLTPTITIWIQGESDANDAAKAAAYEAHLTELLGRVDAEWGVQDLIVVPLLSGSQPYRDQVNAAIEAVAVARGDMVALATDGIPKDADGVHYSRAGFEILAARIKAEIIAVEAP
jgi:hypothetical protein